MGLESWISVMKHNNPRRKLSQARIEQNCMVSFNGPKEVHCDSVVMEGLATYWGRQAVVGNRQGHWVRRDRDIRGYAVSEAVDSLSNQTAVVPIMV